MLCSTEDREKGVREAGARKRSNKGRMAGQILYDQEGLYKLSHKWGRNCKYGILCFLLSPFFSINEKRIDCQPSRDQTLTTKFFNVLCSPHLSTLV